MLGAARASFRHREKLCCRVSLTRGGRNKVQRRVASWVYGSNSETYS